MHAMQFANQFTTYAINCPSLCPGMTSLSLCLNMERVMCCMSVTLSPMHV